VTLSSFDGKGSALGGDSLSVARSSRLKGNAPPSKMPACVTRELVEMHRAYLTDSRKRLYALSLRRFSFRYDGNVDPAGETLLGQANSCISRWGRNQENVVAAFTNFRCKSDASPRSWKGHHRHRRGLQEHRERSQGDPDQTDKTNNSGHWEKLRFPASGLGVRKPICSVPATGTSSEIDVMKALAITIALQAAAGRASANAPK
jgi:hypothetical protein